MRYSRLQRLKDAGFDLSTVVPFARQWHVQCSQCDAVVVNGTPTHEHGCPHIVRGGNDDE
jgi:hypothetical protein